MTSKVIRQMQRLLEDCESVDRELLIHAIASLEVRPEKAVNQYRIDRQKARRVKFSDGRIDERTGELLPVDDISEAVRVGSRRLAQIFIRISDRNGQLEE